MKKTALALLTAGLILTGGFAAHAEDAPRTLSVSGTGSVTVAADTATLYVVIESRGATAAEAARANADTASLVRNAVIAAGASDKEFATANYTLRPEYDPKDPRKIKAYSAQNSMKVVVKDLSRAGAVSDAAVAAGAGRIGSVVFSLEDEEPYRAQAIRNAALSARKEADLIAAGLGCTITGVISATASAAYTTPYRTVLRNADATAETGTAFTPEKQELTANVSIVYEIA